MSRHLPALRPAKVLRALLRAGFYIERSNGSHHLLVHPDKPELRVILAMHNADLKRKTLVSIIDQAGYSVEEFFGLALEAMEEPFIAYATQVSQPRGRLCQRRALLE